MVLQGLLRALKYVDACQSIKTLRMCVCRYEYPLLWRLQLIQLTPFTHRFVEVRATKTSIVGRPILLGFRLAFSEIESEALYLDMVILRTTFNGGPVILFNVHIVRVKNLNRLDK